MGHRFVVLRPDKDPLHGDGEWSCYCETMTIDGVKLPEGARVFMQLPGRKWQERAA
jgi:hypothetical protein